jgi:hypothetical protein
MTICRPFKYNWDKSIPGTCGDVHGFWKGNTIPNLLTDFVLVIIPLPSVYRLNVKLYVKIGVGLTFMAGSM